MFHRHTKAGTICRPVSWGMIPAVLLFHYFFLSDKYDITKHPNFQYTADADDKNAFDIEAFLSARLKLKPNEVCDVYEVDTKGA